MTSNTQEDEQILEPDKTFNEKNSLKPFSNNDFTPDKRRWLIILIYTLVYVTDNIGWNSFGGILNLTEIYFNKSEQEMIWFQTISNYEFIVLALPCSWIITKYFKYSMIFICTVNAIAGWGKYFSKTNYTASLLFQAVLGLVNPFAAGLQVFIAERWFPVKERFLLLCVGTFVANLGEICSYFIPALIVQQDETKIPLLLLIEAILMSIPIVFCLPFIKEKPKNPQNLASIAKKENFFVSVKKLVMNMKFVLRVFMFAIILATYWTILTVLNPILKSKNYSSIMMGMTGSVLVFSGMVGGFSGTLYIIYQKDSKKHFDIIMKILGIIGIISTILFCSLLHYVNSYVMLIFVVGCGFGLLGILPFSCESLQEQVFPVDENVTMKLFYVLSNVFNIVIIKFATLSSFGNYAAFSLLAFQIIPIIYIIFFLKSEFKRRDYETVTQDKLNNSDNSENYNNYN